MNDLPLSQRNIDFTKKIIFIKKLGGGTELYGKTGTGCIDKNCDKTPGGRMIGWFVGVVKSIGKEYVFAANTSDIISDPKDRPAGPRLRETTVDILTSLGLVK